MWPIQPTINYARGSQTSDDVYQNGSHGRSAIEISGGNIGGMWWRRRERRKKISGSENSESWHQRNGAALIRKAKSVASQTKKQRQLSGSGGHRQAIIWQAAAAQ